VDGVPERPAGLRWHWEQPVPLRWLLVDEQSDPETAVAVCTDIDGLFRETPGSATSMPADTAGQATLIGCRPEPALRLALEALARGAGNPGGALHRRRVNTFIYSVAADGTTAPVIGAYLRASVTSAGASAHGDGLLDVKLDAAVDDPMPAAARQIWEQWRAGPPATAGLWTGYDAELRHQWAGAALAHRRAGVTDKPARNTYFLDGRHVTDVEGFFCAMGEAVNGPGGYFGWNAGALDDCLRGGWGAASPFRLVWHASAVARTHLAPRPGRRAEQPVITFEQLHQLLADHGVDVEMR
jgi:hypothetical protein